MGEWPSHRAKWCTLYSVLCAGEDPVAVSSNGRWVWSAGSSCPVVDREPHPEAPGRGGGGLQQWMDWGASGRGVWAVGAQLILLACSVLASHFANRGQSRSNGHVSSAQRLWSRAPQPTSLLPSYGRIPPPPPHLCGSEVVEHGRQAVDPSAHLVVRGVHPFGGGCFAEEQGTG